MEKTKLKRIALHILFWVTIYSLFTLYGTLIGGGMQWKEILIGLFIIPTDLIGVYFTIYFLLPTFFKQSKYIKFLVITIVFILLLVFITVPIEYFIISALYPSIKENGFLVFLKYRFMWDLIIKTMIIGLASFIKIGRTWINDNKHKQEIENQKLQVELKLKEAELNYLKSQTNPHFLFNALNNLYGLTIKKSDRAPEVLLKISSLLDYMLYESTKSSIELEREINNLRNFFDIQRLRYNNESNIEFIVKGSSKNKTIAPLLIMPLVENCFKHGLDNSIGDGFIKIELIIEDNQLKVTTINSISKSDQLFNNSGIGLDNLKKRLELEYKGRYSFDIDQTKNTFQSILILNL